MSLLLLQVTHTEQSMCPVYFHGRQGIIHAVDSGSLISNTTQSNGLRGAGEFYLGPKGWQSVWEKWPLLGLWMELDKWERLLVVHKGVGKVLAGRQRITSCPDYYPVLNWGRNSILNHYFSLDQGMLNLWTVHDWAKVIFQMFLYANSMLLNHSLME